VKDEGLVQALRLAPRGSVSLSLPLSLLQRRASLSVLLNSLQAEEEEEDNVHKPWSIEDDKMLIKEAEKGESIENLCRLLKRGNNGVKARLSSLRNRNSKPFMRLFGSKGVDKSMKIEEVSSAISETNTLRPVDEVITKLLWDQTLNLEDFSFVYTDRFEGLNERKCSSSNDFVKGKERMLIKATPPHRIESIKYKEMVVWDKKTRKDFIFGSGNKAAASAQEQFNFVRLEEAMNGYDDWLAARQEAQHNASKTIHIFCDLDGVLADFDQGVAQLFKGKKPDNIASKLLWPRLASVPPPGFFALLPWTSDGKELWQSLRDYGHKISILTGAPRGGWAENQKRDWCRRELGGDVEIIVCQSKDKQKYCSSPLSVLIDDRKEIGSAWEEAGGKFLHHTSTRKTIDELEKIFLSLVD